MKTSRLYKAVREGKPARLSHAMPDRHGHLRWYDSRVVPLGRDEQGRHLTALMSRDVTTQRDLLQRTLVGTVQLISELIDLRAPGTAAHAARLRRLCLAMAEAAGHENSWRLDLACTLSRLGRLIVPRELQGAYDRHETLSHEEQRLIDTAPVIAAEMLAHVPRLDQVAEILRYQNTGYDGSDGIGDGRAGEDLPWESRVLHLARDFLRALNAAEGDPVAALARLHADQDAYDPALLAAAAPVLEAWHEAAGPQATMELPVCQIRAGDVLLRDLYTGDGRMLLAAGAEVTQVLAKKLGAANRYWRLPPTVGIRRAETVRDAA